MRVAGEKIFSVLSDVVENGFENRTLQTGSLPRRLLPLNSKVWGLKGQGVGPDMKITGSRALSDLARN